VAFRKEQLEGIVFAHRQAERVEAAGARRRAVHAAKVHAELAIDIDPEVVVAREVEHFAALVGEARLKLEREVVVMGTAFGVSRDAVDREEGRVGVAEDARARRCFIERQVERVGRVRARYVFVPLVERRCARNGAGTGRADEVRIAFGVECAADESGNEAADAVLEVRMRCREVAHRRRKRDRSSVCGHAREKRDGRCGAAQNANVHVILHCPGAVHLSAPHVEAP